MSSSQYILRISFHIMMTSSNGRIFPLYWPFVRGLHRCPVNSPHKGQWRGALMFYLICAWINGWVKNREAGDLRRCRAHYDVIVMMFSGVSSTCKTCCLGAQRLQHQVTLLLIPNSRLIKSSMIWILKRLVYNKVWKWYSWRIHNAAEIHLNVISLWFARFCFKLVELR